MVSMFKRVLWTAGALSLAIASQAGERTPQPTQLTYVGPGSDRASCSAQELEITVKGRTYDIDACDTRTGRCVSVPPSTVLVGKVPVDQSEPLPEFTLWSCGYDEEEQICYCDCLDGPDCP